MYISDESNLDDLYRSVLPKFLDEHTQSGYYQVTTAHARSKRTPSIHYRLCVAPEARAWIVILVGRAEAVSKYAEIIYECYQNGFSVFCFDHVGQGQSSRLIDDPQMGYIDHFSTYLHDTQDLFKHVLIPAKAQAQQGHLANYLLAHSMGAAIGALLLQEQALKHINSSSGQAISFSKAALCAPMFGISAPIPKLVAKLIVLFGSQIHRLLKVPAGYFLGQSQYTELPFEENKLTSSKVRYKIFKQWFAKNKEAQLGGVTFQWLNAALNAMDEIEKQADKIQIPTLILQASKDRIVDNQSMTRVINKMPNATKLEIVGSEHEILFEQDAYRLKAIRAIFNFFNTEQSC
uniref:alpha/beta fold hydrolase n=1 Tax=Ningiella ruwaisensis TaxID=2364274 RepID=UPI0010A08A69|nr:alpha/beta fold hydrolase [Ningiella ruwaisensis]